MPASSHLSHIPLKRRYHLRMLFLSIFALTILLLFFYDALFFSFYPNWTPNLSIFSLLYTSSRASEAHALLATNPIYQRWGARSIAAWNHLDFRAHYRFLKGFELPPSPPSSQHDVCLFIGRDLNAWHLWRRNGRSLCVSSNLCVAIRPNHTDLLHTSNFQSTECRVVTPDFLALPAPYDNPHRHEPHFWPCPEAQHRLQLCPIADMSNAIPQPCITDRPSHPSLISRTFQSAASNRALLRGVTIVVPRYSFPANIYHFAAIIAHVTHVAANLRTILEHYGLHKITPPDALDAYPLNILFLGPRLANLPWQTSLETVLSNGRMSRVLPRGLNVHYLAELSGSHVCLQNPILMGQRGHVNAWPFPNSTEVTFDGAAVPKDAVDFRDDIYTALAISPPAITPTSTRVSRVPVPPLVVGYARRPGRDAHGPAVHVAGTVRRFSEQDEAWFIEMLTNETNAANVTLNVFLTTPDEKFVHQVAKMEKVGFVVGIHGANLANCIFMRPFGVLLEIFPAQVGSFCYHSGSNSGLAYFSHEARVQATPEESGCSKSERRCHELSRQRLVKIGTKEDRDTIRNLVKKGISRLHELHRLYSRDGIPVVYDKISGAYKIYTES